MFIEIKDAVKSYCSGESSVNVIDHLSLSIEKGEICVILGPSGSGKSTLLNVIGGLDGLDSGSIKIDKCEITGLSGKQLVKYRKNNLGYIFQFYNLISSLTLRENVCVGEYLSDDPIEIDPLLDLLGLSEHKNKYPSQLSGGQQQRCSIARAIVKNPKILLCDEPTGALDSRSAKEILTLLEAVNKKYGTTMLIVTHNETIKEMADRVIVIKDGKLHDHYENKNKKEVSELEF